MQRIRKIFFPKQSNKIFKGFGPAFLVIALGIGSGEFILWPYLSAHYGFGILWGALLGISIQLFMLVALERHTAFLGEDAMSSFSRVFKYSFQWIFLSTIIGFGWPGFSSMIAQLLSKGFSLSIPQEFLSFIILLLAASFLIIGKNVYRRIIFLQKINVSILMILIIFLFIYYFDASLIVDMLRGIIGIGNSYLFIPVGFSFITFLGAVAYAGSGGNLLLVNSFYVKKEKKGLVSYKNDDNQIVPDDSDKSIKNTKDFTRSSWKQNALFFWVGGIVLILMLAYISYAVLHGVSDLPKDFSFLIVEASIFSRDISPIVGVLFIISGSIALFGVQLGILDFIGRIAGNKPGILNESKKQKVLYKKAITVMALFGFVILAFGISKPNTLIIIGSTINAFSMGVISWLLYRVEKNVIPKYIQSNLFKILLVFASIFYVGFFSYVVISLL